MKRRDIKTKKGLDRWVGNKKKIYENKKKPGKNQNVTTYNKMFSYFFPETRAISTLSTTDTKRLFFSGS